MCGIAGYVGGRELPPPVLAATLTSMGRRGPDHAAAREWRRADGSRVYLLHSRLNIIDLDPRSNQPMRVGSSWITYNGELYNYVELRRQLEHEGAVFRTASDTEVLLAGLNRHGVEFLDACEGMWAFACFDEESGAVRLGRDRFGEKPLYVLEDSTGLYFGSEVKFLSLLRGQRPAVNRRQLQRYLFSGYKSLYKGNDTFFERVREVAPGTVECYPTDGAPHQHRYWSARYNPDEGMSYDAAVEGARARLIESVRVRLRSDVPLAFCLSGGVDSNALIGIAKREFGYDVHGFTVANTDKRYEETELVEDAVRSHEIRHTWVRPGSEDFLETLTALVRQHDAPVLTISYFAHWHLLGAIARQGYRIAVSGSAADEVFSGYYYHHLEYLKELRSQPEWYGPALEAWRRHVLPEVRNPILRDPDIFDALPSAAAFQYLDRGTTSAFMAGAGFDDGFTERQFTSSPLRNRMLNELFHEGVPVLLHEEDLNSMFFSIENRSPFLDRALVDFMNTVPTRHFIRAGFAKAILREAAQPYGPSAIFKNRRKTAFTIPLRDCLDAGNSRVRSAILDDGPIFELTDRERVTRLVDQPQWTETESIFLFSFVNARLFLENAAA